MSRLLIVLAIILGASYIVWGLLPGDRPPSALAICSFLCSMGAIATRPRARQPR